MEWNGALPYLYLFSAVGLVIGGLWLYRLRPFYRYFEISYEETYNLNDLYQIKLVGRITPKMEYLDIPYSTLSVSIDKPAIKGHIKSNEFTVELIRPRDRRRALGLICRHYFKAVNPYITETLQNKKEEIRLIKLSKKQLPKLQKLACNTCKHKLLCQISFDKCSYEREYKDSLLGRGLKVNFKASKEFQFQKSTVK
ncbi:hypothetical protein [Alkaliphilus crotonatoxidans]